MIFYFSSITQNRREHKQPHYQNLISYFFFLILYECIYRGIGGSVAFCRPDSKRKLAVAVTLNRLAFDNSRTTGEIVREIFKKLNEPVPLQYAKKSLP